MADRRRPRIPLIALWRIPAVIALVACAIISRMALGATVPEALADGAPDLQTIAAAMVVRAADHHGDPSGSQGFAFDSNVALEIIEAIYVLPRITVAPGMD